MERNLGASREYGRGIVYLSFLVPPPCAAAWVPVVPVPDIVVLGRAGSVTDRFLLKFLLKGTEDCCSSMGSKYSVARLAATRTAVLLDSKERCRDATECCCSGETTGDELFLVPLGLGCREVLAPLGVTEVELGCSD